MYMTEYVVNWKKLNLINMVTREAIMASRKQGFGGSDAEMFYRIGRHGLSALTKADIERIEVVKGLREYTDIPQTPAMAAGHLFEDWMYKNGEYLEIVDYQREGVLSMPAADEFRIFAHADIYSAERGHVVECKYSQKSTDEVLKTYYAQLQWYHMLGADTVYLSHGWGSVEPFSVEDVNTVDVKRDNDYIEVLRQGIRTLSDGWNMIAGSVISESDLLEFERADVVKFNSLLRQIKRMEEEAAAIRERLLGMFEQYGIKSLDNDKYAITYVPESERRTFDKSAFKKAHPEIDLAEFDKVSTVKSNIRITFKD